MKLRRKKISIFNIPIDSFDKNEVIKYIEQQLNSNKKLFITTINVEFLYQSLQNEKVRKMLESSSLNLADGIGVLWAAKYFSLKLPENKFARYVVAFIKLISSLFAIIFYPKYIQKPIPERISGSDFIWDLSRLASKNNLKIFLLGGGPTIPEQASLNLQTKVNNLQVAGTYEGSPDEKEESKIISLIKKVNTDILFVAYGVPNEELWLERNLNKTGAKIGIGVGGTFDFLAGRVKRAPKFIRAVGLEWFWRLILQPNRYKRQFALPKFVWRVFLNKIQS